jgi:hypothetical protein
MAIMELKHRWSVSHNYLNGITAQDWWRLLKENGFRISPAYWHRGLFITLTSLLNTFLRSFGWCPPTIERQTAY